MLNDFRAAGERWLAPLADRLAPGGADRLTWASLAAAAAAGLCFALADVRSAYLLALGSLLVVANAALDALDGMVARRTGKASPAGDFLDHALDRYADLFIVGGLALGAFGDPVLGLLAVSGMLLTSYMATQAAAVGLARDYGGVLGRADRLLLLALVPPVQAALVLAGAPAGVELALSGRAGPGRGDLFTVVEGLLLLFAVLGHLTAAQRFARARRALLAREGRAPAAQAEHAAEKPAPPRT